MNYITIQGCKKKFSTIALGTTYFGTEISSSDAFRMLDAFAEAGGTTIDTARVYGQCEAGGPGRSEEVIGQWLKMTGMAGEMVLVTKGAHPHINGMKSRINSSDIITDISDTLETLGLDSLDLWMLHRDDPSLSVPEIRDILAEIQTRMPVSVLGASNWSCKRVEEMNRASPPLLCASEIQYSLAQTTPVLCGDETIICMNREEYDYYSSSLIPVFAFSSQAKGFFSKGIKEGIGSLNDKIRERYLSAGNLAALDRVREVCESTGYSPAAVALSSFSGSPFDVVAIIGCSTIDQLKDTLSAAQVSWDKETLAWLKGDFYETA